MKRSILFISIICVLAAGSAFGAIPKQINYQGILSGSTGTPLEDSTVDVEFRIYETPTGGSSKWVETQSVTTDEQGRFNVLLGLVTPIEDTVFNGIDRYLSINVESNGEMPRIKLVSVGYSNRVSTVDGSTGGIISGNTSIQSDLTVSGNVGVGTTTPAAKLNVLNGNIRVGSQVSSSSIEFYPASAGTPTNAGSISGVGGSPNAIAIMPVGNVGIGTTTPTARLTVIGAGFSSATKSLDILDGGFLPLLTIRDDARIGIRSSTPEARLHIRAPGLTTTDRVLQINTWTDAIGFVVLGSGDVGIGTASPAYKLEVSGPVMMEDAAAPSASAGHSGVYSSGGELRAFDAAGNSTQISPHDSETGEWIFYSKNVKTGRVVRVNMEKLVLKIEELTGEKFLMESWEK